MFRLKKKDSQSNEEEVQGDANFENTDTTNNVAGYAIDLLPSYESPLITTRPFQDVSLILISIYTSILHHPPR